MDSENEPSMTRPCGQLEKLHISQGAHGMMGKFAVGVTHDQQWTKDDIYKAVARMVQEEEPILSANVFVSQENTLEIGLIKSMDVSKVIVSTDIHKTYNQEYIQDLLKNIKAGPYGRKDQPLWELRMVDNGRTTIFLFDHTIFDANAAFFFQRRLARLLQSQKQSEDAVDLPNSVITAYRGNKHLPQKLEDVVNIKLPFGQLLAQTWIGLTLAFGSKLFLPSDIKWFWKRWYYLHWASSPLIEQSRTESAAGAAVMDDISARSTDKIVSDSLDVVSGTAIEKTRIELFTLSEQEVESLLDQAHKLGVKLTAIVYAATMQAIAFEAKKDMTARKIDSKYKGVSLTGAVAVNARSYVNEAVPLDTSEACWGCYFFVYNHTSSFDLEEISESNNSTLNVDCAVSFDKRLQSYRRRGHEHSHPNPLSYSLGVLGYVTDFDSLCKETMQADGLVALELSNIGAFEAIGAGIRDITFHQPYCSIGVPFTLSVSGIKNGSVNFSLCFHEEYAEMAAEIKRTTEGILKSF